MVFMVMELLYMLLTVCIFIVSTQWALDNEWVNE